MLLILFISKSLLSPTIPFAFY